MPKQNLHLPLPKCQREFSEHAEEQTQGDVPRLYFWGPPALSYTQRSNRLQTPHAGPSAEHTPHCQGWKPSKALPCASEVTVFNYLIDLALHSGFLLGFNSFQNVLNPVFLSLSKELRIVPDTETMHKKPQELAGGLQRRESRSSTQWKINGVMSSSELVVNGVQGDLFKSTQLTLHARRFRNVTLGLQRIRVQEDDVEMKKNRIKVWYNHYRLETDWEHTLLGQMLSNSQWKQLERELKLKNMSLAPGFKRSWGCNGQM